MTRPYTYAPEHIGRRESSDGVTDTTVYVSIGNSDDKLGQREWSEYVGQVAAIVDRYATQLYGWWFSACDAPWQNAVAAFRLPLGKAYTDIRTELNKVRADFRQDSVAWAETPRTEFL
jgi:hypothetical protein